MPAPAAQTALEALWLPFTHNRHFKKHPRLVSGAKGMYYTTPDGRQRVLDGSVGLVVLSMPAIVIPRIVEAVKAQTRRTRITRWHFKCQLRKPFALARCT